MDIYARQWPQAYSSSGRAGPSPDLANTAVLRAGSGPEASLPRGGEDEPDQDLESKNLSQITDSDGVKELLNV